uniref:Uncharacterized protein n=1 Tax=Aegilops tauschii TaxID=37682 RepID=M8CFB9_AEGTA
MAVFHSKAVAAVVAFVTTSYVDLLLLFGCIWLYNFSFGYVVMGKVGLTLPTMLLVWVVATGAFFSFLE